MSACVECRRTVQLAARIVYARKVPADCASVTYETDCPGCGRTWGAVAYREPKIPGVTFKELAAELHAITEELRAHKFAVEAARGRLERLIELKEQATGGRVVPEADFWLHSGRVEGATTLIGCFDGLGIGRPDGQSGRSISDALSDLATFRRALGEHFGGLRPLPDRTGQRHEPGCSPELGCVETCKVGRA